MSRVLSRLLSRLFSRTDGESLVGYVGVILLMLVGLVFIYWLYYKFVTDKKIDSFVKANEAPADKQKYLAAASIYSHDPYPTMICLKSFDLEKPFLKLIRRQVFKRDWSITNHQTTIDTLDWLFDSGHRKEIDLSSTLSQLDSRHVVDSHLARLITAANDIQVYNDNGELRKIDENAIYNCKGILAWDALRGANVARVCYNLGYLSEEETWYYLEKFSHQLKENYDNWEEIAFSFLLGRYLWSGDSTQETYIRIITNQFTHYSMPSKSKKEINMWQKFPVSSL
ncbi:DUF1266 domain-containing protein [Enterococcus wangshanyuanii]|uniref:DUF1266 domain-containing protein n=1 Tax=Enterococcus wangshanyuanii TaxID=2005703 RepID=A0ABQ1PC60_9ENTE|nr:DUF1266 domain-containing protein [Enterococcus wangshanyuanii]GGC94355.1 hypothetical protein GCM10011573_25010 [Enterococcus wangshanyuanii]